jgi:hypothetical protein
MDILKALLLIFVLYDANQCHPPYSFLQLNDATEENADSKSFLSLIKCLFNNAQYITLISIVNQSQPRFVTDISVELTALFYHVQIPIMTFYETTEATIYNFHVLSDDRRDVLFITENILSLFQYFRMDQDNKTQWRATHNLVICFITTSNKHLYPQDYEAKYHELLQHIWTRYNILNVLVLDIQSFPSFWHGSGTDIVTFNPFLKVGNITGRVESYSIADADTVCQILDHRLRDLHGYILRVTMFPAYPYAPPIAGAPIDWHAYGGVDGNVLDVMAQLMNFKPVIRRPKDEIKFGFRTEEGTYVGSIGDIVYGRSDIAFNTHFIKYYHDAPIQYVVPPVIYDCIVILVPKSQLSPGWMDLFECFQLADLFFLLTFYVTAVAFGTFIKRCLGTEISICEISRTAVLILKMFLTVPIVCTQKLTSFSERIFASSCLLVGVLVVTAIQVTLVTEISSPNYYPDINTLEQLADSGLPIATSFHSLLDTFSSSDSPTMMRLAANVRLVSHSVNIKQRTAYKRDYAAIASLSNVPHFMAQYVGPFDNPLLHAVQESPRGYFLSYVVPKYSPYVQRMNSITSTLIESGFISKWDADETRENHSPEGQNHTRANRSNLDAYSTNDLQTAFFVWASGLSSGILVFIAEIVVARKLLS